MTDILVNPVFLSLIAVLGVVGTWATPFIRKRVKKENKNNRKPNKGTRTTNIQKPDHVKTVATTIAVAPPLHEVGHAVSEAIVPMAETVSLDPSIVSHAAELAGGVAQVSASAGLVDDGSAIETVVEVTKGIIG